METEQGERNVASVVGKRRNVKKMSIEKGPPNFVFEGTVPLDGKIVRS